MLHIAGFFMQSHHYQLQCILVRNLLLPSPQKTSNRDRKAKIRADCVRLLTEATSRSITIICTYAPFGESKRTTNKSHAVQSKTPVKNQYPVCHIWRLSRISAKGDH